MKGQKHYADKYGVSKSTLARWKRNGCDITDEKAVSAMRAAFKKVGAPSAGDFKAPEKKVTSEPVDLNRGESGAAAALERLEHAERSAYGDFVAAIQEGIPNEIKNAREGWLKISESLRKYDVMVEQSRREKGALLPKEEVERILKAQAYYLRLAGRQLVTGISKKLSAMDKPELICTLLEEILGEQILMSVAALFDTSEGGLEMPGWVGDAMTDDLDTFFSDAKNHLKARVDALNKACKVITTKKTKGTKCKNENATIESF